MVAVVTDRSLIVRNTEITLDITAPFGFTINSAGDLATSKISWQCLYSWFIDTAFDASDLLQLSPIPIEAVTETNGFLYWEPADDDTRRKIARGGWEEVISGVTTQRWACVQAIGSVPVDTPAYYLFTEEGVAHDFTTNGLPEEPVKIFGDASHGAFDYRDSELTIRYRRAGYTLQSVSLVAAYALTALRAVNYVVTLNSVVDDKLETDDDTDIDANSDGTPDVAPYSTPTLTYYPGTGFTTWANSTTYAAGAVVLDATDDRWYQTAAGGTSNGANRAGDSGVTDWTAFGGEVLIGSGYYPFNYVIANALSCDRYELWTLMHFWMRQTGTVDVGDAIVGRTLTELASWAGDTITTAQGVGISQPQAVDVNNLFQRDATGTLQSEPYMAAITLTFDAVCVADTNMRYVVYVLHGTGAAEVLLDATGTPISGTVSGTATHVHSLAYDSNSQGHTAGTDFTATLCAIGEGYAGWSTPVSATITRSTTNVLSIAGARDRVFV